MKPLAIKARDAASRIGMSFSLFKKLRHENPAALPRGFRLTPHGDWYYLASEVDAWVAAKANGAIAQVGASVGDGVRP